MGKFILRRLVWAVFTIIGVMILTFLLFNCVTGDPSAQYISARAQNRNELRANFLRLNKLDLPLLVNWHNRLQIVDETKNKKLKIKDGKGANVVNALYLYKEDLSPEEDGGKKITVFQSRWVFALDEDTPIKSMLEKGKLLMSDSDLQAGPILKFTHADKTLFDVEVCETMTCGELMRKINEHPRNKGRVKAKISSWSAGQSWNSQFGWHMWKCLTFQGKSWRHKTSLWKIISGKAKYSLSLTIPGLALGWLGAMIVSCFVAYYRGTWIDHVGVFLCVLGMCIPFLAYMILGQWIMFERCPKAAWGLANTSNIYVPIIISLIAGLGGSVRFYRTVILNEVRQDYVRTARAKGVALPNILFQHVLKNCMLPILTNLVLAIPFLIMGSLLLEKFFGIPGLGDLMVSSITDRDVPIITTMTFLTAIIYVLGLLLTDILYAVFDPRIRLR
ncbi:MAG: ABC transporter permease [Phycisphaerae bacterium]|nr:ABC transporter permease [Phycisphaerae bacterium]